ncbi:nucleotide exchange factor GrpE [Candidatus Saccharibacteria bacterium]|nr:nucleotide exchange factor GrpE [Candidatus Saccharibacteria bacterium]
MKKGADHKPKRHDAERLEQQITVLTEALQRERADAMNVRRRSEEERAKMGSFYKAMVISELLPVIDNFERALRHVPKDIEEHSYIKGVQGVVKQFEQSLAKLGVIRIKTVGEVFDPALHEAVSMEEGVGSREIINEELQSGYIMGKEIIRHAMVKVKMEK